MCDAFVDRLTMLTMNGYDEDRVMDWPLDKFYLVVDSIHRATNKKTQETRKMFVIDNAASIAALFSTKKKALTDYLKGIDDEE